MKLLAIAFTWHDGNISYFDGNKIHYHKLERTKQEKRYYSENVWDWKKEVNELWNIDVKDIDEIAVVFDTYENFIDFQDYPPEVKEVSQGYKNATLMNKQNNPINLHTDKNIYYVGHHYAHSLSSWMLINRESDVNIVFDGAGERKCWSVYKNDQLVDSGHIDNGSLGWGLREAGKLLTVDYGHRNDIAGKVMGLQSYGNLDHSYLEKIKEYGISNIKEMYSFENWVKHKQDALLAGLTSLDWIHTVHQATEECLVDFFSKYASEDDLITYSGGVAQNVIWNTALKKKFKNLVIPPHSSDEGISLGALEWLRRKNNLKPFKMQNFPYIQSDIAPSTNPSNETVEVMAKLLAQGKTVGWYQHQGEAGPRALGNRSIFMDPRIPDGKEKINNIKKRENYRPFGATVLKEHVKDYFDLEWDDDYMLYTAKVKTTDLPAITHVDNTCRVQTIDQETNLGLYTLLKEFYKLTGCPVLLNTSLNLAGKPIAGYPENAKDIFITTPLDCVVIGGEVWYKN